MSASNWPKRPTARVIPIDPNGRALLLRTWPKNGEEPDWWYLIGGRVEPEETHEQAALRELYEESGCKDVTLGACLYTRMRPDPSRKLIFAERVFLAHTPTFLAKPTAPDVHERGIEFRFRWWEPAQMAAATDRFDPPQLRHQLAEWLKNPMPNPLLLPPTPVA